jgi:crotonyl-CoA carboxylase/reductase
VKEARKFGKAIWDITGKRDADIVFEHPCEQTLRMRVRQRRP